MQTNYQNDTDRRVDEIERVTGLRHLCDLMSAATFTDDVLPSSEALHNEEMSLAHGPNWRELIENQHVEGRTI